MKAILSEPVGGSPPKFSTDLTTSGVKRSAASAFSLSCPAQGSPVPSYRFDASIFLLEPVGGSAPKFSSAMTISGFTALSSSTFNLACPAQGAPVPSYRSVDYTSSLQNLSEAPYQSFLEN